MPQPIPAGILRSYWLKAEVAAKEQKVFDSKCQSILVLLSHSRITMELLIIKLYDLHVVNFIIYIGIDISCAHCHVIRSNPIDVKRKG